MSTLREALQKFIEQERQVRQVGKVHTSTNRIGDWFNVPGEPDCPDPDCNMGRAGAPHIHWRKAL